MSEKEDMPPFLGTWNNVYIFILAWFVLTMLVFHIFTQYFK